MISSRFVKLFLLLILMCSSRAFAEEPAAEKEVVEPKQAALEDVKTEQPLDELAALGLHYLSLKVLELEQQDLPVYSAEWYSLEHKRIALLTELTLWQDIVDRVDSLVANAIDGKQINTAIKQWFITQKVIAKLKLNKADEALSLVRQLIWNAQYSSKQSVSNNQLLPLWRRLIIRAYLILGYDEDARKSLLRYQVDYQDADEDWSMLQARVLMRGQRYASVVELLADSKDSAALPLRLLAVMYQKPKEIPPILKRVRLEMAKEGVTTEELWAYQYIIYQANLIEGNIPSSCIELETLLSYGQVALIMGEEYRVSGDDLWDMYMRLGNTIANKEQLLKGDVYSWMEMARVLRVHSLVSSRSLYAVTALYTNRLEEQQQAHKNLIELLVGRKQYLELFNQLYLKSKKIDSLQSLPVEVRYELVDLAIKQRRIDIAGQLMKSLTGPPEGEDDFSWEMRKARVLVLQGDYAEGVEVLKTSINKLDNMTGEMIDFYLQVVFDLQAVKKHEQALMLFDQIKAVWLDGARQREVAFWKAESYFEVADYARSAVMFLRSAKLTDPTMSDNWAKSARFKAAGALVKASLYDDAEKVYRSLLLITANEPRRAVIKQELQQIQLLRNAVDKQI